MKRLPLIFLLGIAVISGCAKQPPALRLIPVTIAFQSWVGHGLFYLAQERGFCREEGIDLVFIDEQLDSDRRDAFKRGMLDFEAGTLDLLITKTAQGAPLAAVMELDQSSGADAIVATENIMKLEDLAGKSVALARNDVGETLLAALLYKYRLSLNSVTIMPGSPEEIAKIFLDGEADACVTWEPQISEALKRPGAHILASTKEDSGIIIATLNARRDLLENNPGLVKKVMRVWFKGLKYYREHPLEASEIISKYYKITPEQYRKQVDGLTWDDYEKQKIQSERKEWLEAFDTAAEVKLANGRISQKPDVSKCFNHELLEKLYEDSQ